MVVPWEKVPPTRFSLHYGCALSCMLASVWQFHETKAGEIGFMTASALSGMLSGVFS